MPVLSCIDFSERLEELCNDPGVRRIADELTQGAERLGLYPDEDACDELRNRIEEASQITVRTAKSAKYREK